MYYIYEKFKLHLMLILREDRKIKFSYAYNIRFQIKLLMMEGPY